MIKSSVLTIVDNAFRRVGNFILRDYFELEQLQGNSKGNSNFVKMSQARAVDNIINDLKRKKEDYSIQIFSNENRYGEELHKGAGNYAFIINPIEGISNFERANPLFAMVVAVEDMRDNSIVASYIYAPAFGNCYFAEKGKGSWVDSYFDTSNRARRMRVSKNNNSATFLYLQDFIDDDNLFTENLRIIRSASLSASMLAAGQVDRIFLKHFDKASLSAGKLLIVEAGGNVAEGAYFVASNGAQAS